MTDYAKFMARARYSSNSDYSSPSIDTGSAEVALTPTETMYRQVVASTTAATMDLGDFSSITAILVRNLSSTTAEIAWVTVHQSLTSPGALNNVVFANANPDTIALAGQSWVTTYKAAAGQYVRVSSATNPGTYLIQTAANALLTLGADETLSVATESATLWFQNKNKFAIQAGGCAMVTGAIVPDNDLVYQSASGVPELEILVVGA